MVVAVAVVAVRLSMPFMARRLIRADTLQKSDVIVVLGSNRAERTIEAAMLYRDGWAPKVLLLRPPDLMRDSLRQKLGQHFPVFLDIQQDLLRQMQVPPSAIIVSRRTVNSTISESQEFVDEAREEKWRRIIVVTSPYHTTRAGSLFERALDGSCEVIVRPDRYESANPDRWWLQVPDRYDVVTEYLSRIYALSFRR